MENIGTHEDGAVSGNSCCTDKCSWMYDCLKSEPSRWLAQSLGYGLLREDHINENIPNYYFIHSSSVNSQGCGGHRADPRNTGCEMKIHSGWNTSPFQRIQTISNKILIRRILFSAGENPTRDSNSKQAQVISCWSHNSRWHTYHNIHDSKGQSHAMVSMATPTTTPPFPKKYLTCSFPIQSSHSRRTKVTWLLSASLRGLEGKVFDLQKLGVKLVPQSNHSQGLVMGIYIIWPYIIHSIMLRSLC